jgi:hypothetical protein
VLKDGSHEEFFARFEDATDAEAGYFQPRKHGP